MSPQHLCTVGGRIGRVLLGYRSRSQGTRSIVNEDAMIEALRATGLAVNVVYNIGKRSFAEQVRLMSETGVLVAAHGAALLNAMFLPQHSVVVEIFPYLMRKTTYVHVASMFGHFHLPITVRHRV